MSHGIYTSLAAGARSFEALDLVSNNLANSNTAGYRAQKAIFRVVTPDKGAAQGPTGRIAERYVHLEGVENDSRFGAIMETGEPNHLALQGEGFLKVETENGELYTRDGTLRVGVDGLLLHQTGAKVLSDAGQPILLQPGAFIVAEDGTITQEGAQVARLGATRFARPEALERQGANMFSGEGAEALPADDVRFIQGALESSNVQPIEQLVELIRLSRFYEAYVKTLGALDSTSGQLNNKVGNAKG